MSDDARRDGYGRYLVVPPDGRKPIPYTRATKIANTLDDGDGLIPWKAAMSLTGLMRRPGLRAQLESLMVAHPHTGPWYGDTESKKAIKRIVEETSKAGGAEDRADIGTAIHEICEMHDRGWTVDTTQEATARDLEAYVETIKAAGITFDTDYIETMVVLDTYKVAGKSDRLVAKLPRHRKPVVADLKTGSELRWDQQSIAVQMAIYAHAEAVYIQGAKPDGSEDRRLPMPEVDQERALIIHLPAGEGRCELHVVDIAAGWEAFQHSMWARAWRSRKDLFHPLERDYEWPLTASIVTATVHETPTEGGPAPAEPLAALRRVYQGLAAEKRSWIAGIAADAKRAGAGIHLGESPSERRFYIVGGLVHLARADFDDDELVRGIAAMAFERTPTKVQYAIPGGMWLAMMNHDRAQRFADLCRGLAAGRFKVSVDDATGQVRLDAA